MKIARIIGITLSILLNLFVVWQFLQNFVYTAGLNQGIQVGQANVQQIVMQEIQQKGELKLQLADGSTMTLKPTK